MIDINVLKSVILSGGVFVKLKLESEKLKELLVDFYILTKIKIVIFDDEFNEIMAYPEKPCDFCTLIKNNHIAKAQCDSSDKEACKTCLMSGNLFMYKCHAGLMEVVAPIKVNDIILGYIMFGQIIDNKDRKKAKEEVIGRCGKYNIDIAKLSEAFDNLIYKNTDQIRAASKIMESCACYLWITELIAIDEGKLIYKLANYIGNNLAGDLSVEHLCKRFEIGRSKLYLLSNKYFGMGIAKYIRKKRVEYAAKLLKENECLVSEAADKAGFEDYNYFSKVFKREIGCVPKEYKKSIDFL